MATKAAVSMRKTVAKKTPVEKAAAEKTMAKNVVAKKTAAIKAVVAKKTGDETRSGLRVRMYRVGFGDFFLVTVPTRSGPSYVLIDCGVHAGNIKSMPACVQDLVNVTGRKLALVIVTHYHADHLSGFATQVKEFEQFEVEAVWITNRLDPKDGGAMKIKSQINALAVHLRMQLAARNDLDGVQALDKAENALGAAGSGNDKAMALVTSGFKNGPPVYYYEAGDEPILPASLQDALTAQILGPAPKDSADEFSASDNKAEQISQRSRSTVFPTRKSSNRSSGSGRRARPTIRQKHFGHGRRLQRWRGRCMPCSPMFWQPRRQRSTARSTTRASSCSSHAMARSCCSSAMPNGGTGRTGSTASR